MRLVGGWIGWRLRGQVVVKDVGLWGGYIWSHHVLRYYTNCSRLMGYRWGGLSIPRDYVGYITPIVRMAGREDVIS